MYKIISFTFLLLELFHCWYLLTEPFPPFHYENMENKRSVDSKIIKGLTSVNIAAETIAWIDQRATDPHLIKPSIYSSVTLKIK